MVVFVVCLMNCACWQGIVGCGLMDKEFYVNVADLMMQELHLPRLKRRVVYDTIDGFVPIIGVECER